jgi:hypothetical protein
MATKLIPTLATAVIMLAAARAPAAPDLDQTRSTIQAGLMQEPALQGNSLQGELLQVVAQVVVDRATSAGWGILHDKISSSLDCDESTTEYRRICKLLATARIQDLVAAPEALLDATVDDFAAIWRPKIDAVMASEPAAAKVVRGLLLGAGGFLTAWTKHGDRRTAFTMIVAWTTDHLATRALECPTDDSTLPVDLISAKAARGVALCLLDAGANNKKLSACDLRGKLASCGADDETVVAAAEDLRQTLLAPHVEDMAGGLLGFFVRGTAQRVRDMQSADCFSKEDVHKTSNLCAAMIEGIGAVAVGLARQDWNRVTVGAVGLLEAYAALKATVSGSRYFKLLAAIGQYAMTYRSSTGLDGPKDLAASRKQIVETLLKETTNRTERHGWVLSIGGSLGAGAMYRHAIGDSTSGWSGPFVLPIGLGLQWYPHAADIGFHAQLGVFDLGQYVTYEDNHDVTVGKPDAKAALAPSVALGVWFGSRATPLFIGPYGGIAPFVLSSGKSEYFIGGMLGAYVPIFDF